MTTPPADVPDDLIKAASEVMLCQYESEFDAQHLSWESFTGEAREILAAVLPLTYRYWFEQAFGTEEEIRARGAEAANRKPDDIAKLCEMVRPGWHELQVRERVALDIEALKIRCPGHSKQTLCWTCRRNDALDDAANIARGEGRAEDLAIGCQRATTAVEDEED